MQLFGHRQGVSGFGFAVFVVPLVAPAVWLNVLPGQVHGAGTEAAAIAKTRKGCQVMISPKIRLSRVTDMGKKPKQKDGLNVL